MVIASMILAACATGDGDGTGGGTADVDCMDAQSGDTINVIYQWTGAEEEKINAVLGPFVEACGVEIVAEATRDLAVLDTRVQSDPPDVIFWPTTAPLTLYTDLILPLDTVSGNQDNYADFWIDLGSLDGAWLAVPVKADPKTLVWYSPAQFDAFGYAVPETFADLEALVEQMVADGNIPWAMGFESDAATGWTGSDFIQDLLLVQQGPDYVWDLISGDVLYNDAGVVEAYETYAAWASDATYTVGGADGTVNTGFLDAIYQVFSDPPEAMMVKQSGFAGGEVVAQYPDLEYGVDFDFFGLPGAQGLQGGADFMMAFNDTPAVQALVNFLTSEAGAIAWAEAGFDVSPNSLALGSYPDAQLEKKAEILGSASGFTPDLGDTIPAPFGDAEWQAIIEAVQGGDIQEALDAVADAQAEALQLE
jgi:alpha-glucoside transport system substrate-binding protein